MTRALALLLLLLAACAGDAPEPQPAPPAHTLRPDSYSAALLLQWADAQWELAGVPADALVVADPGPLGDSGFRSVLAGAVEGCPEPGPGLRIDGCQTPDGRLFIAADLDEPRTLETALHEVGHLLAERYGHLPVSEECPERVHGLHIMCEQGSDGLEPTAADLEFVTGRGVEE